MEMIFILNNHSIEFSILKKRLLIDAKVPFNHLIVSNYTYMYEKEISHYHQFSIEIFKSIAM